MEGRCFGDRRAGEEFYAHVGGNQWMFGRKVGPTDFLKANGVRVGVSFWTKTSDTLPPGGRTIEEGKPCA